MYLSFPRKIALFIIEIGVKVVWVIDIITDFSIKTVAKWTKNIIVFILSFAFILFLAFSIKTGYLSKMVESFFISYDGVGRSNKSFPVLVRVLPFPSVSAKSVIVMEKNKNRLLYEKNSKEEVAPASTVKLMSALVSLDLYKKEDVLKVSKECTEVEGTKAFFPEKSKFRAIDLIYAMLIGSTGDSACVLSTSKVNEKGFVNLMNEKAKSIGMESTLFSNAVGLDNINGGHHSTALDLYRLAVFSVSNPVIEDAVGTKLFILKSENSDFVTSVYNTNRLLWDIPGTAGVKTGTTENAGEVLIYEYKDDLKDIFIVVMGSTDRFGDTKNILEWINSSYTWK